MSLLMTVSEAERFNAELNEFLTAHEASVINNYLDNSLFSPVYGFCSTPSKRIRGELVEIGFLLSPKNSSLDAQSNLVICAHALETLHAGSLIIDDIQDSSPSRRGIPSLHVQIGIPKALNAGNWLYFNATEQIHSLQLPAEKKISILQLWNQTIMRAHMGQALDVGTPIDQVPQADVYSLCITALKMKSGALSALCLKLGAMLEEVNKEQLQILEIFGSEFGVCLQMFDDLGDKKYEDFTLKRPSWIWATAASQCSSEDYNQLISAVSHLPNREFLETWFQKTDLLPMARSIARDRLQKCVGRLFKNESKLALSEEVIFKIESLRQKLEKAYGP